jgi:cytochrome P450
MTENDPVGCPFAPTARPLDGVDPHRERLRAAGPLARAEAPAGGPVWVVTEVDLARRVLSDPRFAKDPALAPPGWDRRSAGLEPTAAEQMSLTTLDGPPHTALRKAFAPLFSAQEMRAAHGRVLATARRLLADAAAGATDGPGNGPGNGTVDLMADFSTRYPLTVLCDLLGIPVEHVDTAIAACRLMHVDYPANVGRAMGGFAGLAAAALGTGSGPAHELAARMPSGSTRQDLEYQVFTLLYAGQLTPTRRSASWWPPSSTAPPTAPPTTRPSSGRPSPSTRRRRSASGASPPPTSSSPGSRCPPAPPCSSTSRASTPSWTRRTGT